LFPSALSVVAVIFILLFQEFILAAEAVQLIR
jgi:hypothetical protein